MSTPTAMAQLQVAPDEHRFWQLSLPAGDAGTHTRGAAVQDFGKFIRDTMCRSFSYSSFIAAVKSAEFL